MADLVHIFSNEHRMYWRAKRSGYTRDPKLAGVYPRSEAIEITAHCGPEKGIEFRDVPKAGPPPARPHANHVHTALALLDRRLLTSLDGKRIEVSLDAICDLMANPLPIVRGGNNG